MDQGDRQGLKQSHRTAMGTRDRSVETTSHETEYKSNLLLGFRVLKTGNNTRL
jgi:hypothetical protein